MKAEVQVANVSKTMLDSTPSSAVRSYPAGYPRGLTIHPRSRKSEPRSVISLSDLGDAAAFKMFLGYGA
ncbi:hypothetical protein ElyMa_002615300 [Elysia marginata]|uniref:Uncharacterized protein n=1 Tax=Elysia marginata TaxID=1093978 RepID=A0AAV4H6E7_9GAST|nr:hypothetical protein ElyMa_002615300 [Elysia marginata]